jgi:pyruvate dehydrogenase E1 component alpha subunit
MSDPQKYRSKEEVEAYKDRDPIEQVKYTILENNILTQAELDEIDAKIKVLVQESVDYAEASPFPDKSEAYKDVYVQEDYPYIAE